MTLYTIHNTFLLKLIELNSFQSDHTRYICIHTYCFMLHDRLIAYPCVYFYFYLHILSYADVCIHVYFVIRLICYIIYRLPILCSLFLSKERRSVISIYSWFCEIGQCSRPYIRRMSYVRKVNNNKRTM